MRLIDADHLEKWIQSRWLGNGGKPTDAPTIYEIVDQIDREDTISYERDKDTNVPSTDCISRQAAIDALRVAYWDDNIQSAKDDPCIVDAMTDWAIRQVKALPSAQPEPSQIARDIATIIENEQDMRVILKNAQPQRKKGDWVYGEDEHGIDGYHCDKCYFFVPWDYQHKLINYIEDYKYCPNCGREMEVENG